MRIYELGSDTFPEAGYVYICHAPDGLCAVLSADGGVYQSPNISDPRELHPAIAALFDNHWRGANATEVAAHPWNGPRVMRSTWTDEHAEHTQPAVDDAFVAVGATRFSDNETQTEESLLVAQKAWEATHSPADIPLEFRRQMLDDTSRTYSAEAMAVMAPDGFTQPGEIRHDDGTVQTSERMEADRAAAETQTIESGDVGHVSSLLGPLGSS